MKNKSILIIASLCSCVVQNSTENQTQQEIFDSPEEAPEYVGGMQLFYKFLGDHLIYPEDARKLKIQGKVYVQFTVKKDGEVANATVVKGVHKLLDDEAVRLVLSMPKWNPGKLNGVPVDVKYTIPINFNLNE